MPDVSSAETLDARASSASEEPRRALDLPVRTRAGMVALGLIPSGHLAITLAPIILVFFGSAAWAAVWLTPLLLFVLPPVMVRASTVVRPLREGRISPDASEFLHWWYTAQWQVLFTRLPFLEECLRLVPGLYSAWLRLWGARVGSLVYWSPGVVILDRPFVSVGSRVVFGTGVRLNPHVLVGDKHAGLALHLARIVIANDVLVGGYSLLLPGVAVSEGEATPPFRTLHAYSRFENGRRVTGSAAPEEHSV